MTTAAQVWRYTWRFMFFFVSNLYALPVYMTWMTLLLPLRVFASDLYWYLEANVFLMLQGILIAWIDSGSYKVFECGDDINLIEDKEALFLMNHQATGDIAVIMLSFFQKHLAAGKVTWIMYYMFRYTNFGMVSTHRKDFFIDVGKDKRGKELKNLENHLKNYYLPHNKKWIILFPEGGFLYKRLATSQEYAKKNGYPVLQNVTLPRLGACKVILDTIGEEYSEVSSRASGAASGVEEIETQLRETPKNPSKPLKWIVDTTIAYKSGKPFSMLGMCIGWDPYDDEMMVHHRIYPVRDVPRDDAALTKWLFDRYTEKDRILEAYYKNGQLPDVTFPEKRLLPKLKTSYLRFDKLKVFLIQLFFVVSMYLHYIFIYKPLYSFISSICEHVSSLFY